MAIPSDCVWEVNTTGSDTAAGGGFSTAQKGATGVDKTYPTPTVTTFTSNLSAVGTTALTCASALFANTMLGNVIQISGQGFYCIQGFTSTTVVTVDRALGTFAATSGWVGGALASPGQAAAIAIASNYVHVKTGTYSVTTTSANVAGGVLALSAGTIRVEGYQTTRGDLGTAPVMQASGIATVTLIATSGSNNNYIFRNLSVDGAGLTSIQGFNIQRPSLLYKLTAINCTNNGFNLSNQPGLASFLKASGCSVQPAFSFGTWSVYDSEAYSNTITGFSLSTGALLVNSLSYANTGASSDGVALAAQGATAYNVSSYANGRDGFRFSSANWGKSCVNCVAEGNLAGWGFSGAASAQPGAALYNCAGFNNFSGNVDSTNITGPNYNFVTGSASFFVSGSGGNFAPNNNAGGGAGLRAAGLGTFPRGLTIGYPDIGAAQSQATGGISRGRQVMD